MPGSKRTPTGKPRPIPLNYIKSWRKYRGLTQQQLADLAGMAQSRIRDYEAHTTDVNGRSLMAIAAALEIKTCVLLSHGPEEDQAESQELRSLYDELEDGDRDTVVILARALREKRGGS
jgi:transcriptional regulator with XRE-family HTH domain